MRPLWGAFCAFFSPNRQGSRPCNQDLDKNGYLFFTVVVNNYCTGTFALRGVGSGSDHAWLANTRHPEQQSGKHQRSRNALVAGGIRQSLSCVPSHECADHLSTAGYASDRCEQAPVARGLVAAASPSKR